MIFAVFIIINSGIMANKKTDMSKLRQILRLHARGESKLKISELTGVSRNTLKKYVSIRRSTCCPNGEPVLTFGAKTHAK